MEYNPNEDFSIEKIQPQNIDDINTENPKDITDEENIDELYLELPKDFLEKEK